MIKKIIFEVEKIIPYENIPQNDGFCLNVSYERYSINENFPIKRRFSFDIETNLQNLNQQFIFYISKGPLIFFKGECIISNLKILNRIKNEKKIFPLYPIMTNKKLIKSLEKIETMKCIVNINFIYHGEKNRFDMEIFNKKFNKEENNKNYTREISKSIINLRDYLIEDKAMFNDNIKILKYSILNFESLPCEKFSKEIGMQFLQIQNLYYQRFDNYLDLYNNFKEKYDDFKNKYFYLLKVIKKIKMKEFTMSTKKNISSNVISIEQNHVLKKLNLFKSHLNLYKILFPNSHKNRSEKKIIESKQQIVIKSILENLNLNPEILLRLNQKNFLKLKMKSKVFGVDLNIPREWFIEKIEEVHEISNTSV